MITGDELTGESQAMEQPTTTLTETRIETDCTIAA